MKIFVVQKLITTDIYGIDGEWIVEFVTTDYKKLQNKLDDLEKEKAGLCMVNVWKDEEIIESECEAYEF